MEIYFETDDIPENMIRRTLRQATILGELQPTYCGASLDYIGVQPVLDGVVDFLPSPLDRPAVEGVVPASGKPGRKSKKREETPEAVAIRKPSVDEPLSALVFKIQADQHGDMCFLRVYSGRIESNSRVVNARTGKKEFINQLWKIQADSRAKLDAASAGDIVGVIGPKEAVTGDTFCLQQDPILLESIEFPDCLLYTSPSPRD